MSWTPEQAALQDSTREFVRREVAPHLQCRRERVQRIAAARRFGR